MGLIETSTRADQERLKIQCLERDGFRCVYSGAYDMDSVKNSLVHLPPGAAGATLTECAHIIPFGLGSFDENNIVQVQNQATIWHAIHRYFPALAGKIEAGNINQVENAITLDPSVHAMFGRYSLTFWPQSQVCFPPTSVFSNLRFLQPPSNQLFATTGRPVRHSSHRTAVLHADKIRH